MSISFTDLIASSIHDMKNSLNVQISTLEGLAQQRQASGDAGGAQALADVIHQASRMNAQLIQLLSLYKLGESIYPVDIAECAIADLIDELLQRQQPMLAAKNIRVQVDCPDDCFWYVDRDLLSGALLNALNNAFQYTRDAIRIAVQVQDASLVIRVEDNGQGYPPRMLQAGAVHADKAVNFASGSTGLGFYFAQQVARLHKNGQRVGSVSTENGGAYGGACFVMRLP